MRNHLLRIFRSSGTEKSYLQKRNLTDMCNNEQAKICRCKVALVTGGCRGIGYHVVDHILKEGAKGVVVGARSIDECCRAVAAFNEQYGENKVHYQQCDLKKKGDLENLFEFTKLKFGKIDILVNNSGMLNDGKWEDTIEVNVISLVRGTLLGLKYMSVKNCGHGGVIFNTASILGLQAGYPIPVYTGTKHFIIGFTRSIGTDFYYNRTKVKVMAFCPGVTDTKMVSDAGQSQFGNFEGLGKETETFLGSIPSQKPDQCGKCVIEMLKAGDNGSIWVTEGNEIYKVNMPDRKTFKPKNQCDSKPEEEK